MALHTVTSGRDIPHDVNVIIEIPAFSDPVKYEVDKKTGALFVDRFMGTAMQYPCNYGYVPHTVSGDGDPVDALVLAPHRLISGSVVRCRPIGMLRMEDDGGEDTKVLTVPVSKLTPIYNRIESFRDISEVTLAQIAHFFEHYKDLEPGKWVKIDGWYDVDLAKEEIENGVKRFQEAKDKPNF